MKKENPQIKTQYDFKTAGSPFQDILIQALIWFGIMAVIYYFLFRKMGSGGGPGGQIFSIGKSRAKLFDENEKVQVREVCGDKLVGRFQVCGDTNLGVLKFVRTQTWAY